MRSLLCIVAVSILTISCAGTTATPANTPQLTDTARNQYNYEKLADATGTLQQAAENATTTKDDQGKPLLSVNTARKIVLFCVSIRKTIQSLVTNWQTAVLTAYSELKASLTPAEMTSFGIYLKAFEVVLASVGVM